MLMIESREMFKPDVKLSLKPQSDQRLVKIFFEVTLHTHLDFASIGFADISNLISVRISFYLLFSETLKILV